MPLRGCFLDRARPNPTSDLPFPIPSYEHEVYRVARGVKLVSFRSLFQTRHHFAQYAAVGLPAKTLLGNMAIYPYTHVHARVYAHVCTHIDTHARTPAI